MSEPAIISTHSRSELETRELIRHFKKRKWRYLFIIIGFGIYSFYLFKFHLLDYNATASFLVNDHSIISSPTLDFKGLESITTGDNFNRTYELINSATTQKHLIEKFGLIRHYGIDSTSEFAYQKAEQRIRSSIEIKKSPFNTISVTVRDRYRYLAADMANEIVTFLETLNENQYVNNIQKKIKVSEAYVKQLQLDNTIKSSKIDSILFQINLLLSSAKINERNSFSLLMQQQQLNEIISTYKSSSEDLINSQKLYNLSLQALNFKDFPAITVVRNAMPAATSNAVTAALLSAGIMILTALLLVLQAYLYLHYKEYINLMFFEK